MLPGAQLAVLRGHGHACLSPGVHHQAPLRLVCAMTIRLASREGAAGVSTRIAPWDLPLRTKLHMQTTCPRKTTAFTEDLAQPGHV